MNFHPSMMRICTQPPILGGVHVKFLFMLSGVLHQFCSVTRTRNFNSFRNEQNVPSRNHFFIFAQKFVSRLLFWLLLSYIQSLFILSTIFFIQRNHSHCDSHTPETNVMKTPFWPGRFSGLLTLRHFFDSKRWPEMFRSYMMITTMTHLFFWYIWWLTKREIFDEKYVSTERKWRS